jgi:hypothetical protein
MVIPSVFRTIFNSRKSRNPSKQLMFFYLHKFMLLSKNSSTTVDYAAGKCSNYKYNLSSKYIAVDLFFDFPLESGLDSKQMVFDDIKSVRIKNDFSICTETIGINSHFDVISTMPTIINFLNNLDLYGILLFNIGNKNNCIQHNQFNIDKLFQTEAVIHRKIYGNFNFETNKFLSLLLAILMFVFPALAKPRFDIDKKMLYVVKKIH